MQVNLKVTGRDLAPSLKVLVEQHFRFAVHPHKATVNSIDIFLTEDGTSGVDKATRCRAVVNLRDGRLLTIERRDSRIESAVQRVAKRVFHSLCGRPRKRRNDEAQCAA
jgi:hypothetical protein